MRRRWAAYLFALAGCYSPSVNLPDGMSCDRRGWRLSAGTGITCAIETTGDAWCWGDNSRGLLGTGDTLGHWEPARVPLPPVDGIAIGDEHACALLRDGTVACWGEGGLLGDGSTDARLTPGPVPGLDGVAQLVAGASHTCARRAAGEVWCWGAGAYGQLGDGGGVPRLTPVAAALPVGGAGVVEIGAGGDTTCAVLEGGGLMCWGRGNDGQIGDGAGVDRSTPVPVPVPVSGDGVDRVEGGRHFMCAHAPTGTLSCFGDGSSGQLGDGTTDASPLPILAAVMEIGEIAAGDDHVCAIVGSEVRCWGDDDDGQTGDELLRDVVLPPAETVLSFPAAPVALAAGADHTCAVLADDRVMCWGSDLTGQLGDGEPSQSGDPVGIAAVEGATQIAAGLRHTCAVVAGRWWCWGANHAGQTGVDPSSTRSVVSPHQGADSTVVAVGAGRRHTCIIQGSTSVVKCWGRNAEGQLGDGTTNRSTSPVQVAGITSVDQLAVGWDHACALDGTTMRCWGSNEFGQIGDGMAPNDALTPSLVSGTYTDLGLGRAHSCARNGGTVLCWGLNGSGQLGLGSYVDTPTPTSTLYSVAADVVAGSDHTCADSSEAPDYFIACWGQNEHGQLALEPRTAFPQPTTTTVGAIQGLAAGADFTCVVTSSGHVDCVGSNRYGQLGAGAGVDRGDRSTPLEVPLPATAVAVTAGEGHACALLGDGRVFCWGLDSNGQLGRGIAPTFAPREAVLPPCP